VELERLERETSGGCGAGAAGARDLGRLWSWSCGAGAAGARDLGRLWSWSCGAGAAGAGAGAAGAHTKR
jgi:hypothetical protein